jgi:N-acetylmuramic acid 6-phosphate etherase
LSGLTPDEARVVLDTSGGELKTAIVTQRLGVSAEEARQRLQAAGGRLRIALSEDE